MQQRAELVLACRQQETVLEGPGISWAVVVAIARIPNAVSVVFAAK